MSEFRSIDIDIDVHKLIEQERTSFSESANDALRRLLGMATNGAPKKTASGRPWTSQGLELPHGTKLRMAYNGVSHEAEIRDGAWIVGGRSFKSPSGAASGVAKTKSGGTTKLDGWSYWHVHQENGQWLSLQTLWQVGKDARKMGLAY